MSRAIWKSMIIGFVFCGITAGQEKKFSGPQVGERITPFTIARVNGPLDVKNVEVGKGDGPVMLVFMHKASEPAVGLMISLEWYAAKFPDLADDYIVLGEDRGTTEQMVKRWARRPFFSKSPMSLSVDGAEGPGGYGLNRNMMMTVVLAKNGKVVANHALTQPNNTDAPKILADIAQVMGQPAPEFDDIRAELRAERTRKNEMRRQEHPVFKIAPDRELGQLMLKMLYNEANTAERMAGVAEQMAKWAGDDESKHQAIAEYCRKLLDGDFEMSRTARNQLQKMAKKDSQ